MVKRLEIFAAALISVGMAFAAPVSQSQARRIAERTLMHHGLLASGNLQLVANAQEGKDDYTKGRNGLSTNAYSEYYIFSDKANNGFVIVSGEDLLPSVIAYSSNSTISSIDNLSPVLRHFLNNYSQYVNDIRAGRFDAPIVADSNDDAVPVVDALCTTIWDQGDPFNMYCPVVNGKNSVVGCVATAMSQIMKFWNWPKRGIGKSSYVLPGYGQITSDFSTHEYDWGNMCDSYPFRPKRSDIQREAVALLCSDCGIAVRMSYSPSGSGAISANAQMAFVRNFGYAASKLRHLWKLEYPSPEEWFTIFKKEFDAGRPVYMSAFSPIGTNDSGHAFVIDGYDTKNFVHVNWGWAGEGNGYYSLDLMNVSGSAYKENQEIIIGIEPDYEGTDNVIEEVQTPMIMDSISYQKDKFDKVVIYTLKNGSSSMLTWDIKASLCDMDGNEVLELSTKTIENLRGNYYYETYSLTCSISPLANIPAGDYGIRIFTRQKDYEEWILPVINGGPSRNWIPVYFDGKKPHFNEVSDDINDVHETTKQQDNRIFNLAGQIVDGTYKGIIIKNGKKSFSR